MHQTKTSGMRVGIGIALLAWLLYTVATYAIQATSGVPYAEWFATAANAWRTGVLSLVAGIAVLLALMAVIRWPDLWRDPVRLPTSPLIRVCIVAWWVAILLRLGFVQWDRVPTDLLLAILATGVLVGFAEEILFRGIFLRAMRQGGRAESTAAWVTAACFGLFHVPNMFMGLGWAGAGQVVLAALSGLILYAFRRHYGRIWPAMVAHGAWDVSTFLAGHYLPAGTEVASLALQLVFVVLAVALLVQILRRDRTLVAIPA